MIDRERIIELLGGEAMVDRFIETFERESAQLCDAVKQHAEAGDLDQLAIAAHSLKSHLRYVGADEVADLAAELEAKAEAKQWDEEAREFMEELLNRLQKT